MKLKREFNPPFAPGEIIHINWPKVGEWMGEVLDTHSDGFVNVKISNGEKFRRITVPWYHCRFEHPAPRTIRAYERRVPAVAWWLLKNQFRLLHELMRVWRWLWKKLH